MPHTVFFRRADGKGTQIFMSNLTASEARRIKQQVFDRDPTKTMVWALGDGDVMLGDALHRDPPEDETTRVMRAT